MRKFLKRNFNSNTLPRIMFVFSLCVLSFAYGYISLAGGLFPHSLIVNAIKYVDEELITPDLPWYYAKTDYGSVVPVYDESSAYTGLSLVTSILDGRKLSARIIDMQGQVVHNWNIDWFDLWPNPTHIPKSAPDYPKARPGTHIHGAVLLDNGDLIFNFTNLGMIRLDVCGNVVWRLEYRTHHSIHLDEFGNLWAPGMKWHDEPLADLPNYEPPFIEFTILKISLEGEVLKEISVFDIFQKNDLKGLLYLSSIGNQQAIVSGDTLHLNDVETFPSNMDAGVFEMGDIMISLRNINTVIIFREEDLKVKYVSTGTFVRQHDADFIDGNTISVYDNFNIAPMEYGHQSRILIKSFVDNRYDVYFSGNEEVPFYSAVMGNHQWLPNGNLLITEADKGRAFEIDGEGNVVWEFVNIVRDGYAGIVEDVQRLPDFFTQEYFENISNKCQLEYTE